MIIIIILLIGLFLYIIDSFIILIFDNWDSKFHKIYEHKPYIPGNALFYLLLSIKR